MAAIVNFSSCEDAKQKKSDTVQISTSENYMGKSISHDYDAKIDSIISQMTLEEKSGMLHGTSMFTTAGVERLGVPELRMADGPLGVRAIRALQPAGHDGHCLPGQLHAIAAKANADYSAAL